MEKAQGLNLSGWVKNLADGSVELEAEGPRWALEQLVAWCRVGPPSARVDDVRARFGPQEREWMAHATLIGSVTLTIVTWVVGYLFMGGAR
jgi:acylphosphatase